MVWSYQSWKMPSRKTHRQPQVQGMCAQNVTTLLYTRETTGGTVTTVVASATQTLLFGLLKSIAQVIYIEWLIIQSNNNHLLLTQVDIKLFRSQMVAMGMPQWEILMTMMWNMKATAAELHPYQTWNLKATGPYPWYDRLGIQNSKNSSLLSASYFPFGLLKETLLKETSPIKIGWFSVY